MSTMKTATGCIELGANHPLERAFEIPNGEQDGGPRKYMARDQVRIVLTGHYGRPALFNVIAWCEAQR